MDPDTFFDLFLYDSDGSGRRPGVPTPAAQWRMWWRLRERSLLRDHPGLAPAVGQGFVLRTAQLTGLGVTRHHARARVRHGTWSVPQPGTVAVVDPRLPLFDDDDPPDRFVVARRRHTLACAAACLRNPGFVVGGRSAAIVRGLPTVRIPPRPHVIAPLELRTHRRAKAGIDADEIESWSGIPLTTLARTVVDIARHDRHEGIVVADAALRERLVGRAALSHTLERSRGWTGVRAAREIVALADPLAESPLESLTRLALHDDGFPPPRLQVPFHLPGMREPYRVDLYWSHKRVILECDGQLKYRQDQRWREKKREIALERLGNTVERVLWADVEHGWAATSAHLWTRLG